MIGRKGGEIPIFALPAAPLDQGRDRQVVAGWTVS